MWLEIASNGAEGAKDEWIRDVYQHDFAAANEDDRQVAAAMLELARVRRCRRSFRGT